MIPVKSKKEQELMRAAGRITGDTLRMIAQHIRPGITTRELDERIEAFIRAAGATPTFLNLYGFPASACISIDDVVVHGIPSERRLREGEIVSIDVGAKVGGYNGDAARTFAVGEISAEKRRLIEVTEACFFEAAKQARAGRRVGDISSAVQQYAESHGCGVVRAMSGHGVGKKLHEEPNIPNFGTPGTGALLKAGHCLAIEPMINLGTFKVTIDEGDGWTCRTADKKPSAHYENTVLITEGEPEILTL